MKSIIWLSLSFLITIQGLAQDAKPRQQALQIELSTGEVVDYLLYEPKIKIAANKRPLLLFLHGGGESGDDLEKVKTHGPPKEIENGRNYPMIVISPLNPDAKGFWDEDRLARFMDAVTKDLAHDKSRVYLSGMSRGGYGAYRLAMETPDRFAALLILCAAAPTPYAQWLGDVPIWLIHGEKDSVIPVAESIEMEAVLKKKERNVKLTIHSESGHDVWTQTFESDEAIDWLLKQKRS